MVRVAVPMPIYTVAYITILYAGACGGITSLLLTVCVYIYIAVPIPPCVCCCSVGVVHRLWWDRMPVLIYCLPFMVVNRVPTSMKGSVLVVDPCTKRPF